MKLLLIPLLAQLVLAQNGTSNGTTPQLSILGNIGAIVSGANPKPYNLSTLAGLGAQAPQVIQVLNGTGPTTLFAPTNGAFDTLIAQLGGSIPPNVASTVPDILKYHAVSGAIPASAISYNVTPTLLGAPSNLTTLKNQVLVLDKERLVNVIGASAAQVIDSINCTNGIIHVVDNVILPPASVSDTLTSIGLTDLENALNATNLTSTVNGLQQVTIFAPSNAALTKAKPILDKLNATQVQELLKYHAVPAVAYSTQLTNGQSLPTAEGENVTISITGSGKDATVMVNDAKVITPNILTSNGVVHEIDQVLIPPSVQQSLLPTMNTAINAINAATEGKDYSLSQFAALAAGVPSIQAILNNNSTATPNATLFAPTDAAFNALVASLGGNIPPNIQAVLPDILNYHFLPSAVSAKTLPPYSIAPTLLKNSSLVQFGNASFPQSLVITKTNGTNMKIRQDVPGGPVVTTTFGTNSANVIDSVPVKNGYIHIIDKVQVPPSDVSTTLTNLGLSGLVGALGRANLTSTVNNLTSITVLAPQNDAFTNPNFTALAGNLSASDIQKVLQYHIIPQVAYTTQLKDNTLVKTASGDNIKVQRVGNEIILNDGAARIVKRDVLTNSGAVDVISGVLVPPGLIGKPTFTTTAGPVPTTVTGSASRIAFSGLFILILLI